MIEIDGFWFSVYFVAVPGMSFSIGKKAHMPGRYDATGPLE